MLAPIEVSRKLIVDKGSTINDLDAGLEEIEKKIG